MKITLRYLLGCDPNLTTTKNYIFISCLKNELFNIFCCWFIDISDISFSLSLVCSVPTVFHNPTHNSSQCVSGFCVYFPPLLSYLSFFSLPYISAFLLCELFYTTSFSSLPSSTRTTFFNASLFALLCVHSQPYDCLSVPVFVPFFVPYLLDLLVKLKLINNPSLLHTTLLFLPLSSFFSYLCTEFCLLHYNLFDC